MNNTVENAGKKHDISSPIVKRIWVLLFLVVLLSAPLSAQTEKEEPPPKFVVFLHADLTNNAESIPFRNIILTSLTAKINELGLPLIPKAQVDALPGYSALSGSEASSGGKILAYSRDLKADAAVTGTYGIQGKRFYLQIKVYDVRTGKVVASVMNTGYSGLAAFELSDATVEEIVPQIQEYLKVFDRNEPITYEAIEGLVFHSTDEGMEVAFERGLPFGSIAAGSLKAPYVPFIVGSKVIVEKRKAEHYSGRQEFELRSGINDVELSPLLKKYRNEISVYSAYGQIAGLGAEYRYYTIPDQLFLAAENYFYLQYDFMDYSEPVIHNDASLSLGVYLLSSASTPIRFGVSAGAGVIVTSFTESDMPVYADYYINFAKVFMDFNFRPWTVFFQASLKYSLGVGNNLLGQKYLFLSGAGPFIGMGVRRKW